MNLTRGYAGRFLESGAFYVEILDDSVGEVYQIRTFSD